MADIPAILRGLVESDETPTLEEPSVEKSDVPRAVGRRRRRRTVAPGESPAPAPSEPSEVSAVRDKVSFATIQVTKGHDAGSVRLMLALACQELGENEAANALIEKYQFDSLFGLRKR